MEAIGTFKGGIIDVNKEITRTQAIDYRLRKEIETARDVAGRADVVIEVRGGVAEVTKNDAGVKVEIIDYDNMEE